MEDLREFLLKEIDIFVFDCDGVLWKGPTMITGAVEFLQQLFEDKKKVFFVSNNSTKSRRMYVEKFLSVGLPWVTEENIICSAFAAVIYLQSLGDSFRQQNGEMKRVYVVGEHGIDEELDLHFIPRSGGQDHARSLHHHDQQMGVTLTSTSMTMTMKFPDLLDDVGAVVVGFDRNLDYRRLAYAHRYLQNPEILFIATNTDSSFPSDNGLLPGNGATVAALEFSSGRNAIVTGKPGQVMMDVIRSRVDVDPSRSLMIGDRIETDILFGKNAGMKTLLVLSGVCTKEKAESSEVKSDFVVDSVADLIRR